MSTASFLVGQGINKLFPPVNLTANGDKTTNIALSGPSGSHYPAKVRERPKFTQRSTYATTKSSHSRSEALRNVSILATDN